jgi:prepilin-type N-terminal cleavage/methylation domain-containing protein
MSRSTNALDRVQPLHPRTALVRIGALAVSARDRGFTLLELLIVLVIVGVLLALMVSRFAAFADRLGARSAIGEAEAMFASGRELALSRRSEVSIVIDTARGAIRALDREAGLLVRDLRSTYGVRLAVTRDSMAYDARGFGRGVANLRLVALRGRASDTLFVSRLGRVRRAGTSP